MAVRKPAAKGTREGAEERLVVEAAQNDPAKFGDLYDIHFERIYAFVARRVRDRDKAEDLTSEVFHKALANLKRYEWRGAPFAAWLYQIATNAISDYFKRAAREPDHPGKPTEGSGEPEQEGLEDQARLFRLVEKLPDDQRRVVFGRFVEQRSIREIAQQLGKSEGAVKQLQFRALEKLRSQMEGAHG
jgi:RNA polymerase sigma-70 factor (ECF subfamily)